MNRRKFFKNLGIAVAAIAVSKPILDALAAPNTLTTGDWITYKSPDGYTYHYKHFALFDNPHTFPSSIRKPLTSYKMYYIDEPTKLDEI